MLASDFYGDQYRWFIGVVKEVVDADRVKVRIFGVHRMDDKTNVSDGDLPLALVMYPVTSSGGGHALTPGKWVCGFFADYQDCQQPIVIGLFKGGAGAADNSSTSSPTTPGAPGTSGEVTPPGTNGTTPLNSDGSPSPTPSPSTIPGNSNAQKIYNFMRERLQASGKSGGNIHMQAAAITASAMAESSGKPESSAMDTNGYPSKGLFAWQKDLLWNLEKKYNIPSSREDRNIRPLPLSLEQQVAYFWDDFSGRDKTAFNKMMAAANAADATEAMIAYEKPKYVWKQGPDKKYYCDRSHQEFARRLKLTNDMASKMQPQGRPQ